MIRTGIPYICREMELVLDAMFWTFDQYATRRDHVSVVLDPMNA